jgi:hypothetical protein
MDDPGPPPSTPRSRPRLLSLAALLSPKSYRKKAADSVIGSPRSRRGSGGGAPRASRDRSSSQGRTRRRTSRRGSTGSTTGDQHVQPFNAEDPAERESSWHGSMLSSLSGHKPESICYSGRRGSVTEGRPLDCSVEKSTSLDLTETDREEARKSEHTFRTLSSQRSDTKRSMRSEKSLDAFFASGRSGQ